MKLSVKAVSVLLAAVMLAGCGADSNSESALPAESAGQSAVTESEAEQTQTPESKPEENAPNGLTYPAEGMNPVTGLPAKYPGQRPIAIMMYNTLACRPQWGIGTADLMIEANTEGQNTRLLTVTEGIDGLEKAGPPCAARDAYLQMILPFRPIIMFNGSDVYSANLLNTFSVQPIDGHYAGVSAFDYDRSRQRIYAPEYGWYANKALLPWSMDLYGDSTTGATPNFFSFSDQATPQNQNGKTIEIGYGAERTAVLDYDGTGYALYQDGALQVDGNLPDAPVYFDNVILLLARSGLKDDWVTREYDLTQGSALYLYGGGVSTLHWQKAGPAAPLKFYDDKGGEISIMPGKTYLGIWGGFDGQSLRVFGMDGAEQPLPTLPEALPLPAPSPEPRDIYEGFVTEEIPAE